MAGSHKGSIQTKTKRVEQVYKHTLEQTEG